MALEIGDRFPETQWRCERHRGAGGWWPGQASTLACHVHKGRDGMHRPQVSIDDVGAYDSISQKVMLEGQLTGGSAFCPSEHVGRPRGCCPQNQVMRKGRTKGRPKARMTTVRVSG